ncbi:hypothetical protein PIB30_087653 [Stylosanthes scabra]|uniref:Uncharacterized protein n=1 Tax=Stylosanthes scabra TaxID=79078 RepID=A0ABU6USV0_9FABA|nr:hypothetical protein [Stylosanthes scabra]
MKVDTDPFEVNSSFAEPCCLGVNMVEFASFEFDTSLGDFEQNIQQVFPGKELAHKEEQVRQRHGPRRAEASSSMIAQANPNVPIAMQWMNEVHRHRDREVREYNEYQNRRNFRGREWRGRGRFNGRFGQTYGRGRFRPHGRLPRNPPIVNQDLSKVSDKGAKPLALNYVVFPAQEKGKETAIDNKVLPTEPMNEDPGDGLYDDEFVEED